MYVNPINLPQEILLQNNTVEFQMIRYYHVPYLHNLCGADGVEHVFANGME